ncbi:MAG TPA: VOC family protein [Bryobacteraceae bacterium]|nr:VOC family protein [Bryobacteraceae bacterium]
MEALISDLVTRFEKGALSRRGLIQGLAMLAAAGGASSLAPAQESAGLTGVNIDHISIQVTDLPRAVAFYEKVFGLKVLGEDKPNEISRLGGANKKIIVSLHHKAPTGIVDHFAIGVENFNREQVTEKLKALGITPSENLDAGFHIQDPEGMNVQIMPAPRA